MAIKATIKIFELSREEQANQVARASFRESNFANDSYFPKLYQMSKMCFSNFNCKSIRVEECIDLGFVDLKNLFH